MNTKSIKTFAFFAFLILILNGCASGQLGKTKTFKHNTPLIKDDIRKKGELEIQKTVDMGPNPTIGDTRKLEKIFGEKPNTPIKDGLEQTLSWLKAQ